MSDRDPVNTAKCLRVAMAAKNIKGAWLAEQMCAFPSAVSCWRRGGMNFTRTAQAAKILGYSFAEFIALADESTTRPEK